MLFHHETFLYLIFCIVAYKNYTQNKKIFSQKRKIVQIKIMSVLCHFRNGYYRQQPR